MPAAVIRSITSPALGASSSMSSITSGLCNARITAARVRTSGPPGLAAHDGAGQPAQLVGERLALLTDRRAVDEHPLDALRLVADEAVAVGGHVGDPADRTGRQGVEVQHHDIGGRPGPQVAAVDAEDVAQLAG